ncbi:dihydrodipicolinate synthase [Botrytis cinerea]
MAATNGSNGHATRRPLKDGIYAPTMTFFVPETEELDIPTIKKHAVRLAEAGLVGLVTMGSNGEAVHLSRAEKQSVTRATREALDAAGFDQVPIIVGATEGIRSVVTPSYFRGLMDEDSVYNYFIQVADQSPLPIILYNYPGAVAGIDMDSDLLIRLAKHRNIIGTKFTCGSTGKLTRVALATNAKTVFSEGSGYMAFGGICDFTAQTLVSGGSGIIAGGANVMPKVCVKVWELYREGKRDEAFELQKVLSKGDWVLTKAAIAGTKSAIQSYYGYGGYPRSPLKKLDEVKTSAIKDGIDEVMKVEFSL